MKKILVVDDEKDFCFFIKKNLEAEGDFNVSICYDSRRALGMAKDTCPDIILLDIMMPGKTGIDVLTDLKRSKDLKNIPIIFLSAIIKEDELGKHKGLIENGHFISKPVKTGELVKAINRLAKETFPLKEKVRTVAFLSRQQIDFLDKLGKDAMFHRGYKLSRAQILSELVDLLIEFEVNGNKIDLDETSLSNSILKLINS